MKHIKLFETVAAFETARATLDLPNVSLTVDNNMVHYNPYDPYNGYEYVDLGLSVKWAKWNVGANSESDSGLYFQWGDTQGYTAEQVGSGEGQKYFGWNDYKYSNNGGSTATAMTKYNSTDGKTVLEASDDAARANMGSNWRMPTYDEFSELINTANTTSAWTTVNGVYGAMFTSKKSGYTDKYVFFPAAGACSDGSLGNKGSSGFVWSSSLYSSIVVYGRVLYFYDGYRNVDFGNRCDGYSVRGVLDDSNS